MDGKYKIKFGKHKGEQLQDLPTDYLQWLAENLESGKFNNDEVIKECEKQLVLREGVGVVRPPVKTIKFKGRKE